VRLRHIGILIALALLATAIVAAPASAGQPTLKQLKQQLRHATQTQKQTRQRHRLAAANLAGARELYALTNPAAPGAPSPDPDALTLTVPPGMDEALAAGLLADGIVTDEEIAALQARATRLRKLERRWNVKVRRLQKRVRTLAHIETWNRRGQWRPLIEIAAREYGVSAAGLYRLMILESSGRRTVVSGPYHGLFQFMHREWAESWNKWRDRSIYDGWAQIQLAALAIGRGMGPSIWTNTYRMAF
jgi:soluble lytic murein transglycosylase-like protein